MAPSLASASAGPALLLVTTHSWPPRRSRRTMLPPIRPRPTMPIRIIFPLVAISSDQRPIQRGAQAPEPRLWLSLKVDPQRAAASFGQHLKVTLRLGRLPHAERELSSRDRQVHGIVAGDLQE